jgi:predicted transcriptional regulator
LLIGLDFRPLLALSGIAVYAENAVEQPFINVEEKIDRFVGRRTRTPDGLKAGMRMQASGLEFHKAFKHRWLAKGVHRFKTHEEADQWMIKMLVRSGM